MLWIFWFQFAGAGSQISMPMPGDVDGALAAPGLPGPTLSLTKQRSFAATGGVPVVPDNAMGSPALNDFTGSTDAATIVNSTRRRAGAPSRGEVSRVIEVSVVVMRGAGSAR